jgi:1-aminocyclopropane-1-carboxylate deaminase
MNKQIQHLTSYKDFSIDVLRLDLLHPLYGGNKFFKLKYNIVKAIESHAAPITIGVDSASQYSKTDSSETLNRVQGDNTLILTFGGAHSNHIYSTAAYCNENNIKVIGVIRGEESMIEQSPTLQFAKEQGMILHFVSREAYQNKTDNDLVPELKKKFGDFYLIPEGGNNEQGIRGCAEILNEVPKYDYVFCACGTACTYTGILTSAKAGQMIIGISVLKGENKLIAEVNENAKKFGFDPIKAFDGKPIYNSTIINDYHFGGYAKHTPELLQFKKQLESNNSIPLDYVYTAKLFYAVYDLINKGLILPNRKILIVHSGGQQGNQGYEQRYKIYP